MTDDHTQEQEADIPESSGGSPSLNRVLLVLVIGIFAVLIGWKLIFANEQVADTESITSVHNDAVADYEAALETGKPVYVLFHSLTCDPCIEISEVADGVVPDYDGEIVFVNVITDDPSGRELATRFSFQYIPTSFFLAPDGAVLDSFTGAMDETAMRSYIDMLLETP